MHFIITDARFAKSRAVHLSGTKLVLSFFALSLGLMVLAAALYHWVFLKGAREGWPVVGTLVRLMVKDEFEQRDRFMRENLDAMARKLGEMQAKMVQIEALGERVSGLAGINPADIKVTPGRGGALISGRPLTLEELQVTLADLDKLTDQRADLMTVMESRLFDQKIKKMMVPTQAPLQAGSLGSSFGWRIDPFTGRSALHTGLDFQALPGTPILAAAGGVVVTQELHHEYGNMTEVDHGNGLITRYAHASRVFVKKGDLIKRGQKLAEVGTTGRSTGPHLHFEVLVQGVPQDPQKFLAAGQNLPAVQLAARTPASTHGATASSGIPASLVGLQMPSRR
jgi:murein DD-endopeptidase MepM/ murein hydrolase activator NlpD